MLTPCGSAGALFAPAIGPKGVPDSSPLPVGSGGGASFWRWGLPGGVGAAEWVPALESVFFIGSDCLGAEFISLSISMGMEESVLDGRACCCC